MTIFRQYMPAEWEYTAGVKTTAINMYVLAIVIFIIAGWKIGLGTVCFMFSIDYIGILINRYKYNQTEKEFKNYVMSGLTPCLLYTKSTDPLGTMHTLVVDDKLSIIFANINAEWLAFQPVIVFLSDKSRTEFVKKYFDTPTKAQTFYKENIAQLPSCKPTDKNLAVIKEVLQYQQSMKDDEYIDETCKSIRQSLSNKKVKK